jgi:hypothetical protein
VFAQVNSRPIDPGKDRKGWKARLRAACVRDARLQDARHTAATLLLQQGVPARVAMRVLGHSQIGLTLSTYSHLVRELAQEATSRMADALCERSQRARGHHAGTTTAGQVGAEMTSLQVRLCGAGGARTHDRGIMSPVL